MFFYMSSTCYKTDWLRDERNIGVTPSDVRQWGINATDAKENLRDYSGHLACQYLRDYSGHLACQYQDIREPTKEERAAPEEIQFPEFHVAQARDRSRNRKLTSLFQSKKKWGSAEELAPVEEERVSLAPHQLMVPAFRPRKFSR